MFNYLFVAIGSAVFAMVWGALHHERTELTVARVIFAVLLGLIMTFVQQWNSARRRRQQK